MSTSTYIIIMVVLVIMSAYFSATETAFSSLNKTKLKTIAEKGNKRAKLALNLSENYDKLISTILIGNNIVNISLSSMGTVFFVNHLMMKNNGAAISTAVITVVVLIFGEISPKSIAMDCSESFAMFSAPVIRVFMWLLTPVNFIFGGWKNLVSKIFKIDGDKKTSQEELLMFVEEVEQEGSIDNEESSLLKNAIEFSDLEAEDILTHRVDLEAVPIDADKEEIAKVFTSSKFSRIFVYQENIDNIVGVLHQKDFYTGIGITKKEIKDIISKPIFIRTNEKADDLLRSLQTNKSHIAVVVDEYGGTYGIVTMEDILEELVGEIWDEHDEVIEDFKKVTPASGKAEHLVDVYNVNGSADFEDFKTFFDVDDETESVSVSGWVAEKLEKIPENNDNFEFENLKVTVSATDSHRASLLKVEVYEKEDGEEETNEE